jgi:hypothetical protein
MFSSVPVARCWDNTSIRPRELKQRPLLGNASNIHAHNNRTVFSVWSVPRCYNREVWSLVSSVREFLKRGLDPRAEE